MDPKHWLKDNPPFSEVGAGAPIHRAYPWTMPLIVLEGDLLKGGLPGTAYFWDSSYLYRRSARNSPFLGLFIFIQAVCLEQSHIRFSSYLYRRSALNRSIYGSLHLVSVYSYLTGIFYLNSCILSIQASSIIAILLPLSSMAIFDAPSPPRYDLRTVWGVL